MDKEIPKLTTEMIGKLISDMDLSKDELQEIGGIIKVISVDVAETVIQAVLASIRGFAKDDDTIEHSSGYITIPYKGAMMQILTNDILPAVYTESETKRIKSFIIKDIFTMESFDIKSILNAKIPIGGWSIRKRRHVTILTDFIVAEAIARDSGISFPDKNIDSRNMIELGPYDIELHISENGMFSDNNGSAIVCYMEI